MIDQAQAREAYIAEKTAEIIDLRARASVESDTTKALKMFKAAKVEEAMLQDWIASGEEVEEWCCDFDDECDVAETVTTGHAEDTKPVDVVEMVFQAILAQVESTDNGWGMVYLDNVSLSALGITERQFSGYCAALTKDGRYRKTAYVEFGQILIP